MANRDDRFLGTWRLVGVDREEVSSGRKLDTDVTQTGYISYTPDGRVMVIIAKDGPNQTKREITCYSGAWTVEGDTVFHDVDIAARQPWEGTRQVRGFRFHGNRLTLTPPTSEDFVHHTVTTRSLTWEKVAG